jgi:hypothetical protein
MSFRELGYSVSTETKLRVGLFGEPGMNSREKQRVVSFARLLG